MKYKLCLILVVLSFVCAKSTQAQNLDTYLTMAVNQNPRLEAAYQGYLGALARVPQVGALPDPQLSLGFFVRPMEQMMGNQVAQISLMQMFPWFGSLDAAKNEASLRAKAKFEAFHDVKSATFYEIKSAWYALYLIDETERITKQNIDIMRTLEAIAISRFQSGETGATSSTLSGMKKQAMAGMQNAPQMGGKMTQNRSGLVDVLRIQMERQDLENTLLALADNKQVLTSTFNRLLNRSLDAEVVQEDSLVAHDLPMSVSDLPDSIVQNHPVLKMLRHEEQAFLAQQKKNKKKGFPVVGVGLQYGILQPRTGNTNPMNGRDMWMPMLNINLPLWRGKYKALEKESVLEQARVAHESKDKKNALLVGYEDALRDFKNAKRRVALFEKQSALAQQALDILTASYGADDGAFEDVLQMQLKLLSFRLSHVQAVVDQNVAVAMLERLMGR